VKKSHLTRNSTHLELRHLQQRKAEPSEQEHLVVGRPFVNIEPPVSSTRILHANHVIAQNAFGVIVGVDANLQAIDIGMRRVARQEHILVPQVAALAQSCETRPGLQIVGKIRSRNDPQGLDARGRRLVFAADVFPDRLDRPELV
jgi:hypothetical protein